MVSHQRIFANMFEPSDDAATLQLLLCNVRRLLLEFDFIRELGASILSKISEILLYETYTDGTVLFQQGSAPEAAYIVLRGRLEVWKAGPEDAGKQIEQLDGSVRAEECCNAITSMVNGQKRRTSQISSEDDHCISGGGSRCKTISDLDGTHTNSDDTFKNFGELIALAGPGTIIGDRGLLSENARTATVVCRQHCELLAFRRDDFERTAKEEHVRIKVEQFKAMKKQLLAELPFFERYTHRVTEALLDVIRYARFGQGVYPFKQGASSDYCYIILSGTVSIWKKNIDTGNRRRSETNILDHVHLDLQRAAWHHSRKSRAPEGAATHRKNSSENTHMPSCCFGTTLAQQTCANIVASMHGKQADIVKKSSNSLIVSIETSTEKCNDNDDHYLKDSVCVSVLGTGMLFGELSFTEGDSRFASALCQTNCEFLVISREDLETHANANNVKSAVKSRDHIYLPQHSAPIIQEIPFFQRLSAAVLTRVPDILQYESASAGTVLCWECDVPDKCYVLLSGMAVALKHPTTNDIKAFRKLTSTRSLQSKCSELGLQLLRCKDMVANWTHMYDQCCSTSPSSEQRLFHEDLRDLGLVPVAEFLPGILFGEDALVNRKGRSATVVCASTCQFLVIDRVEFDGLLREDIERNKMKQLGSHVARLLAEFEVFQDIDGELLKKMASVAEYARARKGITIIQQGSAPEYCYIILRGNVSVFKRHVQSHIKPAIAHIEEHTGSISESSAHEGNEFATAVQTSTTRKCEDLALMLAEAAELSPCEEATNVYFDDQRGGLPRGALVGRLGPGMMFGELAMRDDRQRDATITTTCDCQFLKIRRSDFDLTIKDALKAANGLKLAFLRAHIPAMKSLSQKTADGIMRFFERRTWPKNHRFCAQRELPQVSLNILWNGSVECQVQIAREGNGLTKCEHHRCTGVLLAGSVFGTVSRDVPVPCSIVAASAPCVVLQVSEANLKSLPEVVEKCLVELARLTFARRSETEMAANGPSLALGLPRLRLGTPTTVSKGQHVKGDAVKAMLTARQATGLPVSTPSDASNTARCCTLRSCADVSDTIERSGSQSVKSRSRVHAHSINGSSRAGLPIGSRHGELLNTNFYDVSNRPFLDLGATMSKYQFHHVENTEALRKCQSTSISLLSRSIQTR